MIGQTNHFSARVASWKHTNHRRANAESRRDSQAQNQDIHRSYFHLNGTTRSHGLEARVTIEMIAARGNGARPDDLLSSLGCEIHNEIAVHSAEAVSFGVNWNATVVDAIIADAIHPRRVGFVFQR